MHLYTIRFLYALLYTILVETAVLFLIAKYTGSKLEIKRVIFAGILANSATIPYVWYVFPILIYGSGITALIAGELFAFVVEAFIYKAFLNLRLNKALIISAAANLASFVSWNILFR